MDKKDLDELFTISDMFETTLYALQWLETENDHTISYNSIISGFEYNLNKLKNFCENQTVFNNKIL